MNDERRAGLAHYLTSTWTSARTVMILLLAVVNEGPAAAGFAGV